MEKSIILVSAGNRVTLAEYFIKNGWDVQHVDFSLPGADHPIEIYLKSIGRAVSRYENSRQGIEQFLIDLQFMEFTHIMSCHDNITSKLAFHLENEKHWVHGSYLSSKICYDKVMFEAMMIEYPRVFYNDNQVSVVKDRFGCGSKGIDIVERLDIDHYRSAASFRNVIQPLFKGTEFTVDAYYDELNNLTCFSCRVREKVIGGEVVRSRIVENEKLYNLSKGWGEHFRLKGPATLQFIGDQLIEINDRVGGGITLSLEAGFDLSSLILSGGSMTPTKINKPLKLSRCYRDFYSL